MYLKIAPKSKTGFEILQIWVVLMRKSKCSDDGFVFVGGIWCPDRKDIVENDGMQPPMEKSKYLDNGFAFASSIGLFLVVVFTHFPSKSEGVEPLVYNIHKQSHKWSRKCVSLAF